MTPNEIREARRRLGLSLDRMAEMLGYDGQFRKDQMHKLETGAREIRPPQARLLRAYLEGYRPPDWPP